MAQFVNWIDVLEKYFSSGESRERRAHYPSDALSCRRHLWYKWTNAEESNPVDRGGHWAMRIGTSIHDKIQLTLQEIADDLEKRREYVWPSFSLTAEHRTGDMWVDGSKRFDGRSLTYPIRGRIDTLFLDRDQKVAIKEMKTKYGRGMDDIRRNGPDPKWLAQGAVYLVLTRNHRVYYPVVSRDNSDRMQFVMEYEGNPPNATFTVYQSFPGSEEHTQIARYGFDLFTRVIDRLAYVERHVESGEIPERDYQAAIKHGQIVRKFQHKKQEYKSDWQCSYCVFRDRCWSDELEEHAESNNAASFGGADERASDEQARH